MPAHGSKSPHDNEGGAPPPRRPPPSQAATPGPFGPTILVESREEAVQHRDGGTGALQQRRVAQRRHLGDEGRGGGTEGGRVGAAKGQREEGKREVALDEKAGERAGG